MTTTPVQASHQSYDRQAWRRGYLSQPNEFDYWIENIEGEIPIELSGTLFRNGPGLLDIHGQRIHHPFDGDGMISAITFDRGRAHYRNRFVRTAGYVAEQAAGKILYRGVFGTQKPGGWLANAFDFRLKNIANTQVIYWGGKLLALWEAALPHRLDPATLETLGLESFDGQLGEAEAFAAHPRIDPDCAHLGGGPCLTSFAIKPGLSTAVTLYELNPSGTIVHRQTRIVPGFAFIHDFVTTPNYAIFFQNPVRFNPLPFLLGFKGAGECVHFQPDRPTRLLVIPRFQQGQLRSDEGMQVLEIPAGFVFHHANAFEQVSLAGDSQIIVDSVCYAELPELEPGSDFQNVNFESLAPGQLWRFTLNLSRQTVSRELLDPRCCEFPSIHPAYLGRPYRYTYLGSAHAATGNAPLQAILKVDLQQGDRQFWSFARDGFVSEPNFVPRPGATAEDEGWLLVLVYDSYHHRSDVAIFDAQQVDQGPIARLHLQHHIPYGLHGTFTPQKFI